MGNKASASQCGCFPGGRAAADGSQSPGQYSASKAGEKKGQLLSKYELGEVLGQGAFGIVYLCKAKSDGGEYAVKMIDKVESPLADIQREVDMLRKLAHPTVVTLHDVFYEKCFVCMVLDIYKGGDLIEGMQRHWETKGMIPPHKVKNITKQTVESLAWLHSLKVAHRDVKADNYLMDRKDILDPDCRVLLSDFGTVLEVKEKERLSEKCGTQLYWSPEFYRFDYGMKVDMWAIGVVMYGIVSGRFPFKGRKEVETKVVTFKASVPTSCQEFVKGLLSRDEKQRLSGSEAMRHEWLGLKQDAETVSAAHDDKDFKPTMREGGANAGIDERRRELVDRLEQHQERQKTGVKGVRMKVPENNFEVANRRAGKTVKCEWWSLERVKQEGIINLDMATSPSIHEKDQTQMVGKMLQSHGVDISLFGTGKFRSLADFAGEVQSGESRLMLDATEQKTLVRVVDLVLLKVVHGSGDQKKYLIHSGERYADGRERRDIYQLPGTKKAPHENVITCGRRILSDRLNMQDCKMGFNFVDTETYEEDQESPHYPGVRTVYRKAIVEAEVLCEDDKVLERIGLIGKGTCTVEDAAQNVMTYQWFTEAMCSQMRVKMGQSDQGEVSALVYAPVGFAEEELQSFMETAGVDASAFGEGNFKTLQEFSAELATGEATLQRQPDGSTLRVVDIVALVVTKPGGSGEILVEVEEVFKDGTSKKLKRLPAKKRRPDENEFLAAQNILDTVLKIAESAVKLNPNKVRLLEVKGESHSYPGIKQTLYRKRIISAEPMVDMD